MHTKAKNADKGLLFTANRNIMRHSMPCMHFRLQGYGRNGDFYENTKQAFYSLSHHDNFSYCINVHMCAGNSGQTD